MNAVSEPGWMLYAGFGISSATLLVLFWYAWLTNGIKKASNQQTEGLSKPVVTGSFDRKIMKVAQVPSMLTLRNVGNGPALEVCYTLNDDQNPPKKIRDGELAYIEAGGCKEISINERDSPMAGSVECRFQGPSGLKYRGLTLFTGNGSPQKFTQVQLKERRCLL